MCFTSKYNGFLTTISYVHADQKVRVFELLCLEQPAM
jgi:hypothetical protein